MDEEILPTILLMGSINGLSVNGASKTTPIPLHTLNRVKEDEKVLEPFEYLHKVPSKYHRRVVEAFNHWLKVPEDKLEIVRDVLCTLHTASLLIDDMQDDSHVRYGVPAAHVVYSAGLTLNAASHALHLAFKKLCALGNLKLVNSYLEIVEDLHRGQGIELYWRDTYQCPTEAEYIDMVKQKSAAMFVLFVQVLQAFSDNREDYFGIALLVGTYYTIRDDYCNLFNQAGLKSLGEKQIDQRMKGDSDITDGKFTLPMIHAIQSSANPEELIHILKQRTSDPKEINRFTSLLREQGSDTYMEYILRKLERKLESEINRLGGNPLLTTLIKELGNWRNGIV